MSTTTKQPILRNNFGKNDANPIIAPRNPRGSISAGLRVTRPEE